MKAKKILTIVVIVLIMISGFALWGSKSKAATATDSHGILWEYDVVDGKARLIKVKTVYVGTSVNPLYVPDTIAGYPVVQLGTGDTVVSGYTVNSIVWPENCQITTIGDRAFQSKGIEEIVIPDSVTSIGNNAFYSGTNVSKIQLGNNVQTIGDYAFCRITSGTTSTVVENLVIPDSVTSIGQGAFANVAIKNLTIGNGIETVRTRTFQNCNIETLTLGSNIKTIESEAFIKNKIAQVTLPNTVQTIGDKAFNTNMIESVTLPNSVTSIGTSSFENNKISELTIGTGIIAIPEKAFAHNELESLTIPGNVKTIGLDAFRYNRLTSLTLNEGLQTIGENALRGEYNDPSYNQIAGTVNIPSTVTSIGQGAFYGNKIETLNFGTANPTIGNWAFQNNSIKNLDLGTGLQTTGGNYVFNDNEITNINFGNVKTITDSAFSNAFGEIDLVIPGTVETINGYAFSYNTDVKSLVLNEGIKTIRNYAFCGMENCKGDLTVPNSVTTLGYDAFENMKSLDGILTLGTGVNIISGSTFKGMEKISRVNVPSNVTKFDYGSLDADTTGQLGDVYIDNIPENVFIYNQCKRYIHWRNETHNINVNVLPGVHILNAATGEELTTGDYACESDINIKVILDDGYTYSDLVLIVEDGDNYETLTSYEFNENQAYDLVPLARNRRITVQSISQGMDLALRTFISRQKGRPISESREPVVEFSDGAFNFNHTKVPVVVEKDDVIEYTIRVYNQGLQDAKVDTLNVFIPEGLELASGELTNIVNGWHIDQNDSRKVLTTNMVNSHIKGYTGNTEIDYKDITLKLKVTKDRVQEFQTRLNMIAEIGLSSNIDGTITEDSDSTAGSITAPVSEDYKQREAGSSDENSYIKGQEDDDDFECVVLPGKAKVTYNLNLRKADIADEELLEGATFRLYNEQKEKITDAVTNENGEINFGTMTTYGEGQDIYYMEEIVPPAGYAEKELCKIKIIVNKTIIDEQTGECAIDVVCEKVDYRVDTSRYKFVPVTNKTELAKIGSGETLTINGKEYVYSADANYKLMNDIDLSGSEWTPIENEIVGIFDGNGKTISGLTITSTADYNKSEVGLFRVFSGIFENTTFTDVNININNFANDAANISGKTGVGAIAGVMKEGVIYKVTVSGTVTANVDNVGGFVGHTMPERIVRAIDCTNNAAVSGKKNVGGVIGCSLGAVSMVGTHNTGAVKQIEVEGRTYFDKGNAGGLVGYVESTDYQETLFTGAYKDDNDEFILVARNEELEDGTYKVTLENRDRTTRNLIPNGVYTVYDKDKNVITGLENITLTDGTADLGTYTFKTVGKTTYYLKENSPATGYRPLTKYIKVVVTRAWDGEDYKFYVTVADTLLSNEEFTNDVPEDSSVEVNPKTGKTNEITEHEDVYWNVNKAEFIDCTNTASIGGTQTYHAGGLLGTACKCHTEFDNCSNSGTITGTKVAGLAANITCYKYSDSTTKIDLENWSKLINCKNTGAINEVGNQNAVGGLAGEVSSNIKAYKCTNTGVISAKEAFAGGIIGKVGAKTQVIDCHNYGKITSETDSTNPLDDVLGGIIGGEAVDSETKYDFSDRELLIEDCTNTADLVGKFHVGGIIGILNSDKCIIKDCTVEDPEGEEVLLESNQGNIGGIVSMIYGNKTSIKNCNAKNVKMNWIGEGLSSNSSFGQIGGIAGMVHVLPGNSSFNEPSELIIDDCTVEDSTINNVNAVTASTCRAGIIAQIGQSSSGSNIDAYITNCTVRKTDVINGAGGASTYNNGIYDTAGIVGITQNLGEGNLEIEKCTVDECNIKTLNINNASEFNTAGIIAVNIRNKNTKIVECNVKKSTIVNESNYRGYGGNDNAAGIIAFAQDIPLIQITDCNVYDNTSITQYQGNVGGIQGYVLSTNLNHIEKCTFKDSSIDCRIPVGDNSNTGGIVGSSSQPAYTYINDCEVDNVDVYTESNNAGGIIGHVMEKCDIDNCIVNEVDITKNLTNGNESTLGGIAGYILGDRITNCTVSNSNIKNTYKCTMAGGIAGCSNVKLVDNCKVIGSEIDNDETDFPYEYYNAFTAAGLIGFARGDSITNSRVENTTVKGGNLVSGFIGITNVGDISDNTIKGVTLEGNNIRYERAYGRRIMAGAIIQGSQITVDNVNVDGLTATGNIETFAGFIGALEGGSTIQNSSVKGLEVDIKDVKSTAWGAVSGFAGTITGNSTLKNVSVKDSEMTTDEHIAAGLVGSIVGSMSANIDGATVENVKITHNNSKTRDYDGLVSGLIGINPTGTSVTVNNAKVKDCTLVGNQADGSTGILHMGGLMAFVDGDNSFTNCDVTGTTITNNTTGMTGGAAGMTQYDEDNTSIIERMLVLNNVTVDGKNTTVITGKNHVGGILGFGKINVTTPVTVKDIVLKTIGLTSDEEVNAVIGVATDHTGESDVTVENVTIE